MKAINAYVFGIFIGGRVYLSEDPAYVGTISTAKQSNYVPEG